MKHAVLAGLLAAIVVVAVLVVVTGDRADEKVAVAVAVTTTTTSTSSTTTSSSTTSSSTTTAVPPPTTTTTTQPQRGELLAAGDGWEVRLVDGCVVVNDGARQCDRDVDAWLLAAPLADGRTVHAIGGRHVVSADAYSNDGIFVGDLPVVDDAGTGHYVITDALPDVVIVREGPGGPWTAGVYGGQLITDGPAFPPFSSYQRATGSLSFGRFQEVGGVWTPDRCALARQVTPSPAVIAEVCLRGGGSIAAVLVPTQDPALFDLFGIAFAVHEWRCERPDGGSCGAGPIAGIAGFAGIIAGRGPIDVGDAEEVTIVTDQGSVVVPVPHDA